MAKHWSDGLHGKENLTCFTCHQLHATDTKMTPERQQLAGKPSVIRLGDEGQRIRVIDNDHDVNKNNELEDLRICLFIFPNPGESKW